MKVVFLVSNLMGGGVERTVSYLSSYLASNSIDTTIISLSNEVFYNIDPQVKYECFHIPRGYRNAFDRVYKMILRYYKVNSYLLHNDCDLVFCMAPEMIRYLSRMVQYNRYKLISSERNNPLYDSKRESSIKKKAFPRCDGIVFQTERAKRCFSSMIQSKGIVIPNAVGNDLAYQIVAPVIKSKKFSSVGRLGKQKDYITLINAFSKFNEVYSDYSLDIYGSGDDLEPLKNRAAELGVKDKVTFKGTSTNALIEIADSSAFILSSIYEGMPNVLLEAMAIGMPCISTDCPFGPRELIDDGVNGLLVPVGDSDSLAKAMIKVVNDKEFSNSCGKNARKVLEDYSIEIIARRYLEYMFEVVQNNC